MVEEWLLLISCWHQGRGLKPECEVHVFHFLLSGGWFQLVQVQRDKITLKNLHHNCHQHADITSRHPVRRISRTPSEKSLSKEVTGQPSEERCTFANLTRDWEGKVRTQFMRRYCFVVFYAYCIRVLKMLNLFHKMEFLWSVIYQGVKAIPEYQRWTQMLKAKKNTKQ